MRSSPYLQELLVYIGHLDVYNQASEIISKLLRVGASTATVYRTSERYGAMLEGLLYQQEDRQQPDQQQPAVEIAPEDVVYAGLDGSMLLTREGWREVKLGRVFTSAAIDDAASAGRGQPIIQSEYTAHLGRYEEFMRRFRVSIDRYGDLGERLVFLSDGARWISQSISSRYPRATHILDFYHAVEYLASYALVGLSDAGQRARWLAQQKARLLAGHLDAIITEVDLAGRDAGGDLAEAAECLVSYYRSNRERMRYDEYIRRGLYIGSGSIESAHRTVIQKRMKLSGQRWTISGAEHMLNLRVSSMSGNWSIVQELIRAKNPAVA